MTRNTGRLVCASCNPNPGEGPTGVFDTQLSGEGFGLLVDRPEIWKERWLAGSIPGWTLNYGDGTIALYQSRYLSDSGRLFFDSPDQLVPSRHQRANRARWQDVYEYEPDEVGSCAASAGCVGLISSGASEPGIGVPGRQRKRRRRLLHRPPHSSSPADTDHAFDIYDAHVCSPSTPCLSSTARTSDSANRPAPAGPAHHRSANPRPPTASVTPRQPAANRCRSRQNQPSKPKPLTRAQELAKALTACRSSKNRHKRTAKREAGKRYAREHTNK